MTEDRRGPRPLSWLANRSVEAIDMDELIAGVDVDAIAQRIDINALVEQVDVPALLDRVEPDDLLDKVDPDRLLDRVDPNRLLDRVDPDRLLDRVDPNRLLDRVDPNRLLDRVDPNRLLDRVDPDRLLDRVDLDRLMDRVDVEAIVNRSGISEIVAESTGAVAGSLLDVVRRQLVALDTIVGQSIYRLTGRDPRHRPAGPVALAGSFTVREGRAQVSGRYAGPISRLVAFVIDALLVFWVFTLSSAGLAWVGGTIGLTLPQFLNHAWIGFALFVLWAFNYWFISLGLSGRTVGKAVIGLSILQYDGAPVTGAEAAARTLVMPLSFLFFGLGLAMILLTPRRLALHDAIARTCEVYDWGDRPAELPAPLTAWIERRTDLPPPPQ